MSRANSTKNTVRLIATSLGFALVGGIGGFLIASRLKAAGKLPHLAEWHFAAVLVLAWMTILWHELGHVAGGWLSGFRLLLLAAGPLKIERSYNRLRLRFNRQPALWGGLAATAPLNGAAKSGDSMLRALLLVVAGGPSFSLIGALLLAPAYWMAGSHNDLAILLGIAGALSLVIALATLLPASSGGYKSDGARLLQLFRGGPPAERWASMAVLSGMCHTLRPRDWPAQLVESSTVPGDRSNDGVSAAWLRACYHEDCGDLAAARSWVEQALENIDQWAKPFQPILHATAAGIYARLGHADLARVHMDQVKPAGRLPRETVLHAEAMVLSAEGRMGEAAEAAQQALRLLPEDAHGPADVIRDDLRRIISTAAHA